MGAVNLEKRLKAHMIGQDEAVKQVSQAICRSQTGARNPNRPLASFLFDGASGVGRTKLAQAVAIEFCGSKQSLFRVDMSRPMLEKQFLSLFTDSICESHNKVVLISEIEKAPPVMAKCLLQIIDNGEYEFPWPDEDGLNFSFPIPTPRTVDFRNDIIIMTSQIGQTFASKPLTDWELRQRISQNLTGIFRAQIFCRIDAIVLFKMLSNKDLMMLVEVMVRELADRMQNSKSIGVEVTDELKNRLITVGRVAKQLKWAFTRLVEDQLADRFLKGTLHPGCTVTLGNNPLYEHQVILTTCALDF